jgi:very-short-patch-repair endonuclease
MDEQLAPDARLEPVAAAQGGVIGSAQARAAGLTKDAILHRIRRGRLHVVHRGVFAVGHRALEIKGRRWAAVLACGDGAVLSHASAAAAWELRSTDGSRMHVTVPTRAGRAPREGIVVHRPRSLPSDEVTTLDGLPITTAARTLLDLAATGLRGRPLEAVLDLAERRRCVDWAEVDRLIERHPRRAGSRALAATLGRCVPGTVETFSVLEEIVLELCDRHGIPRPRVNQVVEGRRRDFFWPHRRVVVEADSYGWHRSPSAFEEDRERDVRLTLAGLIPLRFTYSQCTERRSYVADSILAAVVGRVR